MLFQFCFLWLPNIPFSMAKVSHAHKQTLPLPFNQLWQATVCRNLSYTCHLPSRHLSQPCPQPRPQCTTKPAYLTDTRHHEGLRRFGSTHERVDSVRVVLIARIKGGASHAFAAVALEKRRAPLKFKYNLKIKCKHSTVNTVFQVFSQHSKRPSEEIQICKGRKFREHFKLS